ncbi:hypothetical protein ACTA71_005453 [Dictyostelium dimigraforme]
MKFLLILIVIFYFIKQSYSEDCLGTFCTETRNCFDFVGCSNETCLYSPKSLDDGIRCTVDSCDDEIGILHAADNSLCPPDTLCDISFCDENQGCISESIVNCPLPNICQISLGCISSTGQCKFAPVDCDDGNDCTVDSCDPIIGCVNSLNCSNCFLPSEINKCFINPKPGADNLCEWDEINCDDGNPCSDDTCGPNGCTSTLEDLNCYTGNQCLNSVCTANGCIHTPINCDDGNPCSDDTCDPTIGCQNYLNNTKCNPNGNKCLNSTCTLNGCQSNSIICNDGIQCSDDGCNPSTGCQFNFNNLNCNDGNKCTIDQCGYNGCTHTNVTCPPQKVPLLGLIGLFCRNHICEPSTGNCVLNNNDTTISLLCAP